MSNGALIGLAFFGVFTVVMIWVFYSTISNMAGKWMARLKAWRERRTREKAESEEDTAPRIATMEIEAIRELERVVVK